MVDLHVSGTTDTGQLCSSKFLPNSTYCHNILPGFSSDYSDHHIIESHESQATEELLDCPWYHGCISRASAESMVLYSGQFLIRNCISNPGDFVLTCNWDGRPVHFMINRIFASDNENNDNDTSKNKNDTTKNKNSLSNNDDDGQERDRSSPAVATATALSLFYQFEDEQYPSIPALIRAYLIDKKAITRDSMCVISEPVIRKRSGTGAGADADASSGRSGAVGGAEIKKSRREIDTTNGPNNNEFYSPNSRSNENGCYYMKCGGDRRPVGKESGTAQTEMGSVESATFCKRPLPPVPLNCRKIELDQSPSCSKNHIHNQNQLKIDRTKFKPSASKNCTFDARGSTSSASGCTESDRDSGIVVPSKPRTLPSSLRLYPGSKDMIYSRVGCADDDEDYHEYCDIDIDEISENYSKKDGVVFRSPSSISAQKVPVSSSRPPPLPPRGASNLDDRDSACVPDISLYDRPNPNCSPVLAKTTKNNVIPTLKIESRIVLDDFGVDLVPADSKPLDDRLWSGIQEALLGLSSYQWAVGTTREDCKFLDTAQSMTRDTKNHACGFLESISGLSLLLVPHGEQLRIDVVERSKCWRYFVVSSLVKEDQNCQRTQILAKWIDVARELKDSCRNFYGFSNVMSALCSKQVSLLMSCWTRLRSDFTELALAFETQLRPCYVQLQKSMDIYLIQRNTDDRQIYLPDVSSIAQLLMAKSGDLCWLFDWEDLDAGFGLDAFWARLSQCRQWINENHKLLWRKLLDNFEMDPSQMTKFYSLLFRTEFHMKFLWGSAGAQANAKERHDKLELLLNLMAEKCELLEM